MQQNISGASVSEHVFDEYFIFLWYFECYIWRQSDGLAGHFSSTVYIMLYRLFHRFLCLFYEYFSITSAYLYKTYQKCYRYFFLREDPF